MHPKWIIALAIWYLAGVILSGILEAAYVGTSEASIFHGLIASYESVSFSNWLTGFASVVKVGWSFMGMLWTMFWWDYSFFYGSYEIIRYFFLAISIGIIASLLLAWVRGSSSA